MYKDKRVEKKKTVTMKRNLNPIFNESFAFDIPTEKLRETTIVITVMDKDKLSRNDVIGKVGGKAGGVARTWPAPAKVCPHEQHPGSGRAQGWTAGEGRSAPSPLWTCVSSENEGIGQDPPQVSYWGPTSCRQTPGRAGEEGSGKKKCPGSLTVLFWTRPSGSNVTQGPTCGGGAVWGRVESCSRTPNTQLHFPPHLLPDHGVTLGKSLASLSFGVLICKIEQ